MRRTDIARVLARARARIARRGPMAAAMAPGATSGPLRRPALGAASVIVAGDGRVLLVRHTYGALNWELPGGGTEPGESVEETAIREAREEAGVTLDRLTLSGIYWEPGWGPGGLHHVVFRTALAAGSAPPRADGVEASACDWFAPDALPRPLSDLTARRIADALAQRPPAVHLVRGRRWLD